MPQAARRRADLARTLQTEVRFRATVTIAVEETPNRL
jgi:hypothetical protein